MKQLRGLYAQTFFIFRTALVYYSILCFPHVYPLFYWSQLSVHKNNASWILNHFKWSLQMCKIVYVCACVHTYVHICINLLYISIRMCVCVCVCVYTHIHTHTIQIVHFTTPLIWAITDFCDIFNGNVSTAATMEHDKRHDH